MSKFNVGDIVKANEKSNGRYTTTTKGQLCIGKVLRIDDEKFCIKITEHKDEHYIGQEFTVNEEYFDLVKGANKMQIELRTVNTEAMNFNVGDLLVMDNGVNVLVIKDSDNVDYRALNLDNLVVTDYRSTKGALLSEICCAFESTKVIRVIPAAKIKISEIA